MFGKSEKPSTWLLCRFVAVFSIVIQSQLRTISFSKYGAEVFFIDHFKLRVKEKAFESFKFLKGQFFCLFLTI
jgi:hypothetical protein